MDTQCMPSSSSLCSKSHKNVTVIPPLIRRRQKSTAVYFKYRMYEGTPFSDSFWNFSLYWCQWCINLTTSFSSSSRVHLACACRWRRERREITTQRSLVTKAKKIPLELSEEPVKATEKKGTIAGAVALIIGTTIGSGILALPQKASPAVKFSLSLSLPRTHIQAFNAAVINRHLWYSYDHLQSC